jgi:hypothetical protein
MVTLVKDKKGTILVQTVVMLPLLILVVIGGFEVWKVMSVRQSLTSGTLEAATYLSFNHGMGDQNRAEEKIIHKELSNNDLIGDTPLDLDIRYYDASDSRIEDPTLLPCGVLFSVETELRLPWAVTIPGLSPMHLSITTERQVGQILCSP